jgi:hypothetical protein
MEVLPDKTIQLLIGLDDNFNFVNKAVPGEPGLRLDVQERCTIVFKLSERLLGAGWKFRPEPFLVRNDFGVNFSSYAWAEDPVPPFTEFQVICEHARMGEYKYSLLLIDGHGQYITLDPMIENGTGHSGTDS